MKTVIMACLASVSVVSMYLGYSFFHSKTDKDINSIKVQKIITTPAKEQVSKKKVKHSSSLKHKKDNKNIKQDKSVTLKQKNKSKKKSNKLKKNQREFKELLEENIEFFEMT